MSTTAPETVKCAVAHVGPHGVGGHGREYPRDDPRVVAAPQFFVPADLDEELWPHAMDRAMEQQAAAQGARDEEHRRAQRAIAEQNPVKLSPRLLKATQDFVAHLDGKLALVEKGSVVVAEDTLAVNNPDYWRPDERRPKR